MNWIAAMTRYIKEATVRIETMGHLSGSLSRAVTDQVDRRICQRIGTTIAAVNWGLAEF